jgi:nucleoside-diphosphate-sugar epimerase
MQSSAKGVALVTGSAQGIGRGIALRLAEDGFDLALNDLPSNSKPLESLVAERQAKGRKTAIVLADVTVEAEVKAMVDNAVAALGSLDVVSRRPSPAYRYLETDRWWLTQECALLNSLPIVRRDSFLSVGTL